VKSLLAGEKITASFHAGSKLGPCTVYMTNFGFAIETRSGTVLDLTHGEILSCLPTGKYSAKLAWAEGQSIFELILRCDKPALFCSKYRQVHEDHVNLLKRIGLQPAQTVESIAIKNPLVGIKRFE
jgi:hypothetical protein